MPMRFRCPACRQAFAWPTSPDGGLADLPNQCPNLACGAIVAEDKGDVVMPFISSAKHKSADSVYRAMERGSEHRQEVAAEMLGVPKHEVSDIKITDMKDNLREGEIAAKTPVSNVVTQAMNPSVHGYNAQMGAQVARQAAAQPGGKSGVKALDMVRSRHPGGLVTEAPVINWPTK